MTEPSPDPMDGARDAGREELLKATAAPAVPRKKRRWLLKIVIGLPVFLVLLVLATPAVLSSGPVRRKIETAVLEATGRRVTLDDHSVGYTSPVTISNFVMYEKDGTTPFLKIEKASVKVEYGPLKDHNVVLETFEMSGVDVRIVKHRDGTLSTDDIGKKEGASKPAEPSGGAGGNFKMGAVSLRNVNVTYVDEGAGKTYRMKGLTITAGPGATPDEIVAQIAGKVQVGETPAGDIDVKATLLALSNGKPRDEITGSATVAFNGFDVAAMAPQKDVDFATGAVRGSVKAKLLAGGDVEAGLEATLPLFKWGEPGKPPMVATSIVAKQDIAWHRKTNRIEILAGGKFQMNDCDLQVQGSIELPTDDHDVDNPIELLAMFNADLAHFHEVFPASLGDQDMKGPLRSNWAVNARNMDRIDIQGSLSLIGGLRPTDYSYQTHGEDGKVTPYFIPHPGHLTVTVKGSVDLERRAKLAEGVAVRPWSSLDGLVMDLKIETPWIKSNDVDLKQLSIIVGLNEQKCDIRRLDFRMNDGDVLCTGAVAFDSEDPAWNFHTTVKDPPVAYSSQFSGLAALINPALYAKEQGQVTAAMSWDIELQARGFNMDGIKKTIEGSGTLGLKKITLAGSPMLTELYSKLQLSKQTKFEYSLMDQKFHIKSGKVYNEFSNWQGDGKEANITIAGETDFDGNLKQTITVTGDPKARWGDRTGAVVDIFNKAGGLPLGGTVESPKIDIDFEKALEGVAKGLLENPDVKEKAEDLLNNIFKKKKKK